MIDLESKFEAVYLDNSSTGNRDFINLTQDQIRLLSWLEDRGYLDSETEVQRLNLELFPTI